MIKRQPLDQTSILKNYFVDIKSLNIQRFRETSENSGPQYRILNLKSLTFIKKKINSRIYVIGASKAALGFLNKILSNRDIEFTNLNLISKSFSWKKDFIKIKSKEDYYDKSIFNKISKNINLINGSLKFINRKSHYITLTSLEGREFYIEYDYLILCNSLEEKSLRILKQTINLQDKNIPSNIFDINSLNHSLKRIVNEITRDHLKLRESKYY